METLNRERPNFLAECLSDVSSVRPYVQHKSGPYVSQLVASFGAQSTRPLREWSFPSTVDSIDCRYIERWLPIDDANQKWRLRLAYFHLYLHTGPNQDPKEILAFHWEPFGDSDTSDERELLRRPHFHWVLTRPPLGRSHVVVTLTVAPDGQSSPDYLNLLLREVMNLVKVEVLIPIESNPEGWP